MWFQLIMKKMNNNSRIKLASIPLGNTSIGISYKVKVSLLLSSVEGLGYHYVRYLTLVYTHKNIIYSKLHSSSTPIRLKPKPVVVLSPPILFTPPLSLLSHVYAYIEWPTCFLPNRIQYSIFKSIIAYAYFSAFTP